MFYVLVREYEVKVFVSLWGFLYADEIPNFKWKATLLPCSELWVAESSKTTQSTRQKVQVGKGSEGRWEGKVSE